MIVGKSHDWQKKKTTKNKLCPVCAKGVRGTCRYCTACPLMVHKKCILEAIELIPCPHLPFQPASAAVSSPPTSPPSSSLPSKFLPFSRKPSSSPSSSSRHKQPSSPPPSSATSATSPSPRGNTSTLMVDSPPPRAFLDSLDVPPPSPSAATGPQVGNWESFASTTLALQQPLPPSESPFGSGYVSPFGSDDVTPPLPMSVLLPRSGSTQLQSSPSASLLSEVHHSGSFSSMHSAPPSLPAALSVPASPSASPPLPSPLDRTRKSSGFHAPPLLGIPGFVSPFADLSDSSADHDEPSLHLEPLHGYVSPFGLDEPLQPPKQGDLSRVHSSGLRKQTSLTSHTSPGLNLSDDPSPDSSSADPGLGLALRQMRTPLLLSLIKAQQEQQSERTSKLQERIQELRTRHEALLLQHRERLELSGELLDRQIGLSASLSADTRALAASLDALATLVYARLDAAPSPDDARFLAQACLVCDQLGGLHQAFVLEELAVSTKASLLEAEHLSLAARHAHLDSLQADLTAKFNAVSQTHTHIANIIQSVTLLSQGILLPSDPQTATPVISTTSSPAALSTASPPSLLHSSMPLSPSSMASLSAPSISFLSLSAPSAASSPAPPLPLADIAELPRKILDESASVGEAVLLSRSGAKGLEPYIELFSLTQQKGVGLAAAGGALALEVQKVPSLTHLINMLTDPVHIDPLFQKHFLLTYRYLCSPITLARMLILRFCATPPLEEADSREQLPRQKSIQIRVLSLLKFWTDSLPQDFADLLSTSSPTPLVLAFLRSPICAYFPMVVIKLVGKLECPDSSDKPPPSLGALPAPPSEFLNPHIYEMPELLDALASHHVLAATSPRECARQLSLQVFDVYAALQPSEFFSLAWSKEGKEQASPNVQKLVQHFNGLSGVVIARILDEDSLESRTKVLLYMAQLAIECSLLNNFHATLSLISGLQHSSVYRLKNTWMAIPPEIRQKLDDLTSLLRDNSKLLRERVNNATPPCIPYIGIYLTDLTFIEEGNSLHLDDGSINIGKLRSIARRIEEFLQFRAVPYVFQPVRAITRFFSDYSHNLSPDQSHARSLMLELPSKASSFNADPRAIAGARSSVHNLSRSASPARPKSEDKSSKKPSLRSLRDPISNVR